MNTRIKHNDLTHYFLRDHNQLPDAYLRSCRKFFKDLSAKQQAATNCRASKLTIDSSIKQQAPSNKRQAVALWRPGVRVKNRFNRKV